MTKLEGQETPTRWKTEIIPCPEGKKILRRSEQGFSLINFGGNNGREPTYLTDERMSDENQPIINLRGTIAWNYGEYGRIQRYKNTPRIPKFDPTVKIKSDNEGYAYAGACQEGIFHMIVNYRDIVLKIYPLQVPEGMTHEILAVSRAGVYHRLVPRNKKDRHWSPLYFCGIKSTNYDVAEVRQTIGGYNNLWLRDNASPRPAVDWFEYHEKKSELIKIQIPITTSTQRLNGDIECWIETDGADKSGPVIRFGFISETRELERRYTRVSCVEAPRTEEIWWTGHIMDTGTLFAEMWQDSTGFQCSIIGNKISDTIKDMSDVYDIHTDFSGVYIIAELNNEVVLLTYSWQM